jgi:aldehyde dehydrogenase (NAD+)
MVSPSDGGVFAKIARGTAADVDAAVKAARHAFEEGAWSKLTAVERGRLMTKLGAAILANHEELSQLEARDCGKPMKQAAGRHLLLLRATSSITAAPPINITAIPFLPRRLHGDHSARAEGGPPATSFRGIIRRKCSAAAWRQRWRWAMR